MLVTDANSLCSILIVNIVMQLVCVFVNVELKELHRFNYMTKQGEFCAYYTFLEQHAPKWRLTH
jgi:hypothetical protein